MYIKLPSINYSNYLQLLIENCRYGLTCVVPSIPNKVAQKQFQAKSNTADVFKRLNFDVTLKPSTPITMTPWPAFGSDNFQ